MEKMEQEHGNLRMADEMGDMMTPPSGERRTQGIEESGEFEPMPKPDDNKSILTPDQRIVMHRISEAIAMLVYSEEANQHIVKLATQGAQGVVYAVEMIVDKVARSTKPGIPRELIPMVAMATLVLLQDFLAELGQGEAIDYREVLPVLIDRLAQRFDATRPERLALRKLKGKIARGAHAVPEVVGSIGDEMARPDEDSDMAEVQRAAPAIDEEEK